jgi:hypothetical protein
MASHHHRHGISFGMAIQCFERMRRSVASRRYVARPFEKSP